ncbi:MAG: hypothetical protein GY798_18755 [Hyphomicrobiales bacterium]|nr:hypothetical protein [Hyphomicrobiales bacterium]
MLDRVEDELLAEARSEVGYADHKASLILAALGIGFSAFLGGTYASDWRPSDLRSWGEWAWWLGAVAALLAVGAAALAVWPRLGDRSLERPLYYWGQVSKTSSIEDMVRHLEEHPPDPLKRTQDQLWHLSRLVASKYRWVRSSLVLAAGSTAMFILAGISAL